MSPCVREFSTTTSSMFTPLQKNSTSLLLQHNTPGLFFLWLNISSQKTDKLGLQYPTTKSINSNKISSVSESLDILSFSKLSSMVSLSIPFFLNLTRLSRRINKSSRWVKISFCNNFINSSFKDNAPSPNYLVCFLMHVDSLCMSWFLKVV